MSPEIQVIVKSPAQKTEDQIVKCNLDWTVHNLKRFISENFPLKPAVTDQRLIYSGHLLKDECTLREIFRPTEQDNFPFTVHLVFCQKNSTEQPTNGQIDEETKKQDAQSNNSHTSSSSVHQNSTSSNQQLNSPNISQFSFNLTNDVASADFANLYVQQMQQYQQMYVNYMTQFFLNQNNLDQPQHNPSLYSAAMSGLPVFNTMLFNPLLPVPNLTDFSPLINPNLNSNANASASTTTEQHNSSSSQQQNDNQINDNVNQAQNNVENDLDGVQNGWLDMINIFWNILIVLSLVSASFSRSLFVLSVGFLYYLYQTGAFSIVRIRLFGGDLTALNNDRNIPNNNEEQLQQMMDTLDAAELRRRNVENGAGGQVVDENTDINNNQPEQHFMISKFRFFCMVVSSLFSSLMPHNDPLPAN